MIMQKKYLLMDLSKFFDNAVFQPIPAVSNVQIGIDGLYLIESIFSPKICTYENIDFQIQKNTEGFDNLSCDGQTLLLHDVNASEICFLGFSEFGTIRDTYTIGYQQFEKEFDFVFKTLHTHGWQGVESEQNNRCIPVLQTFGSDGQKHRLYVWRQILDKTQKINKIVLPVNLSIHIVAMSFGL